MLQEWLYNMDQKHPNLLCAIIITALVVLNGLANIQI